MSEEKNHIGPLDQPEMKKNIFKLPEGYFEQFEDRLRDRLEAGESELENSEHLKAPVFEAPEGYFDQLEDRIKAKIHEENSVLSREARLKETVFEAPEGYFESFSYKLQARIKAEEEEETKEVPLYQKNWFRLAVAAVLVLGFFLFRPTDGSGLQGETLTDETMLAYLSEPETDLDLIASLDGFDMVIDEILEEETAGYDFDLDLNPELDYEFEYCMFPLV